MTPEILSLVLVAAIVVLAAFAQAVTGFGFALVAIPLLATVTGPQEAIIAVSLMGFILTGGAAWQYRKDVVRADAVRFIWAGALGMPLGLLVLLVVSEQTLTLLVGVVVLAAVVAMTLKFRVQAIALRTGLGVLGGALLTSTGMNGPPIVIGIDGSNLKPVNFRATIQVVFFVQGVIALAMFATAGLLNGDVLRLVAVGIVALPVGWVIGNRVFSLMGPDQFRIGVLCMLTLSASVALVSAI